MIQAVIFFIVYVDATPVFTHVQQTVERRSVATLAISDPRRSLNRHFTCHTLFSPR